MTTSFTVKGTDPEVTDDDATVSFEDAVVVTGTIVGKDGGTTATLSGVAYDAESATLTVAIDTEPDEASGEFVTMALVGIDYRVTVEPDGQVDRVVVEHDGVASWRTSRTPE